MFGPSKRMAILDSIGRELQKRFTFSELDIYLKSSKISGMSKSERSDSKWAYAKERLSSISDKDILVLAKDLDLITTQDTTNRPDTERPDHWREHDQFRIFLSHVSTNTKVH